MPRTNPIHPALFENIPLFADLPQGTLSRLSHAAEAAMFAPGESLFRAGETPRYMHVLVNGSVQLTTGPMDGKESVVELLRPVDAFILAAVLTSKPYLMSAKAVDDAELLLVPAELLRELVTSEPKLALTMLGSVANEYRQLVRQIKDLRLRTTAQRLGIYLLNLMEREGTSDTLALPYDKKLLAARLHMTPESLSRSIVSLREHGVDIEFDQVHVHDIAELRRFCRLDNVLDRLDEDLGELTPGARSA